MTDYEELIGAVRKAGYRMTPQRESVLSVLAECGGHLTAETILARVRKRYPYLNKSGVYRSLDLLSQLELVSATDLGQGRVEYELRRVAHHHLVCRGCERTIEVDDRCFKRLAKGLARNYGFQADMGHFAVFGRCRQCVEKGQK